MDRSKHRVKMSSSSTAFSSDGVDVISRQIASSLLLQEGVSLRRSEEELREYYEVNHCIEFINSNPKIQRVSTWDSYLYVINLLIYAIHTYVH